MIHVGKMIAELLEKQHKTKKQFAQELGVSASSVSHITRKGNLDVKMLHRIGTLLRYNFFKHFPIAEEGAVAENIAREAEKNRMIEEYNGKIAEQVKVAEGFKEEVEGLKREMEMLKQENGYLKEINGLLKKKTPNP